MLAAHLDYTAMLIAILVILLLVALVATEPDISGTDEGPDRAEPKISA